MNTNLRSRVILSVSAAGIACGAALGLAGTASAAEVQGQQPIVAAPHTVAHPAASATPGAWWHQHHPSLLTPSAAGNVTQPGA
jgi:hypothetical protein